MLPWTPEREATAERLYIVEGRSAADTAAALGGTTRNAIIGLAHRRGWMKVCRQLPAVPSGRISVKPALKPTPTPRVTSGLVPGSHPPKPSKPAVVFGALPSLSPAERGDLRVQHHAAGQAAIRSANRQTVESPDARLFLEARRGCKWPIETESGLHMCCNPVTRGSYCTGHAAIAYTGIPQPRGLARTVNFMTRNDGVERVRKPKADNDSLWDDVRAA